MRIAIASDHGGYRLKGDLVSLLRERAGIALEDLGTTSEASTDYPDYAHQMARAILAGKFDRGILVCGTGIGVAMAAGKIKGVRAATVHDRFTAQMSREHNDSNVLCLGARVLDAKHAVELATFWISVKFEGGRHERRVRKIDALGT